MDLFFGALEVFWFLKASQVWIVTSLCLPNIVLYPFGCPDLAMSP